MTQPIITDTLDRPKRRAPQAWAGMVKALHRDLPASLRKSAQTRRAMRALRHRHKAH